MKTVLVTGSNATGDSVALKVDNSGRPDVTVNSSALPSGAATEAKQDTGNSSLSSIDSKLSTTNSSLASIDSDIDVALSTRASESTLSTLNGKVNDNYGVATGAVRTAAQIGNATGVADFGAGTTSAQTVRVVLPTDQTSIPAAQSGTWNINNISGTISLPTGASTSANQTTEITSLQILDDVPSAMNVAFSKGAPAMGQLDDAATTAATEDNVAPVRITAQRAFHSNLRNSSGTEITSTLINSKQRLDVNTASETTPTSAVPLNAIAIGGKDTSGNLQNFPMGENFAPLHTQDIASYTEQQKTFSAATNIVLIGTTETPFYLLKNPNGSGKKLKLVSIKVGAAGGTIRIYHTPTITTNGTALTIVNNRIQTSPTATVAQAFLSPTISANGTLMDLYTLSAQVSTFVVPMSQQIVLNANFNLLITAQNGANNTNTHCTIVWAELT